MNDYHTCQTVQTFTLTLKNLSFSQKTPYSIFFSIVRIFLHPSGRDVKQILKSVYLVSCGGHVELECLQKELVLVVHPISSLWGFNINQSSVL